MAFRSVPRPSSPPDAKASTECSYRARYLFSNQLSAFSHQSRSEFRPLRVTADHHAQKQAILRPLLTCHSILLSFYSTPLNANAAVSEADTSLHPHIRSDLADRGTPRDAPEPDSHFKRTQHPTQPKPCRAPNGHSKRPHALGSRSPAPNRNFTVVKTIANAQPKSRSRRPAPATSSQS
jgi:hypothetical protein